MIMITEQKPMEEVSQFLDKCHKVYLIGCGTCATKCPYDAIVMHDTGDTWGDDALPERLRGRSRKVASKCDLCYTSDDGPACVNNCPHSCAFRIGNIQDFQSLLSTERAEA